MRLARGVILTLGLFQKQEKRRSVAGGVLRAWSVFRRKLRHGRRFAYDSGRIIVGATELFSFNFPDNRTPPSGGSGCHPERVRI
jgi:hypothetical protein